MTKTHTPGPWTVERVNDRRSGWRGLSIHGPDKIYLANLVGQLDDSEMANADLMSAAPDLFAVALSVSKWNHLLPTDVATALRAAIQKAEGKE